MPVTISNLEGGTTIDVKRMYVPSTLKTKCPACGEELVQDFSREYLSSPPVNKPFQHGLYCCDCDHEFEVTLKLVMTLEVVGET